MKSVKMLVAVSVALLGFGLRRAQAHSFIEYTLPTASSAPYGITTGPDGNVWFTEFTANKIGVLTVDGSLTEYTLPTAGGYPLLITVGPDGNLWFTRYLGQRIGMVTTSGSFTEYAVPAGGHPTDITAGPDGNLWFTSRVPDQIGKVTTNGEFTMYDPPTPNSSPASITAGPDGNLWFIEYDAEKIAKVSTSGSFTEYDIGGELLDIIAGPDGNLWYTADNKIVKMTTSGSLTEYPVPTANSSPAGITVGPDGNLWFTEINSDKIGMVTTAGSFTEYAVPTANSFAIRITTGSDGNLWFTEYTGNKVGRIVLCGDNVVGAGEQCDDGNNVDGDCCASDCQYQAEDTPCTSDGITCTTDACDASGTCLHLNTPAPSCANSAPAKSQLTIKTNADPNKTQVQFRWAKGSFPVTDFGDPTSATDYTLCVYDNAGSVVSLEAPSGTMMCGEKPCWALVGSPTKGIKFNDKTKPPTHDGIKSIAGKASEMGKGAVLLKAQGSNIPPFTLGSGLTYPVTAQLVTSDEACWEAEFASADEKKNDGVTFKASHRMP